MSRHLMSSENAAEYARQMHRGVEALARHIEGVERPGSGRTPAEVEPVVAAVDLDEPLPDLDSALAELQDVYLRDAVWFHDPGYAAHLNCPVVLPALVAELFVSGINSSLDTWDQSGGGTYIERELIAWTARRIGFTTKDSESVADGVFTSGGTQSNLQALLMARAEACLDPSTDPGADLATTLSRFRILASDESHFSVRKSAQLLGLGRDAVVTVATDASRRLDVDDLDATIRRLRAADLIPMAVVATAGTTDFGVIDPLTSIADVCAEHGVWLHVDAAYGGGLLVSRRRRSLLDGIERADSVTVDYHKTFFQPVSSSAVIVRDAESLRHVTYHADYLNPRAAQLPNQVDKSLQTTRRFDALKLWMTLRTLGADQIGDYVDAVVDLARTGYDALRDDAELEVAAAPQLSTLVLRYRPAGTTVALADDLNPRIRTELARRGEVIVAGTVVDGHGWLKLTLLNPATTVVQLHRILDAVRVVGRELLDEVRSMQEVAG